MKNYIIALCAPTGDGKTELIHAVCAALPDKIQIIKSVTTRPQRGGKDGISYEFVTTDEFERRRVAGHFVETVVYGDSLYGFDRYNVDEVLATTHGIRAVTQSGILSLQHAGYLVTPIKIIAKGNEDIKATLYEQNPQRKNDDEVGAKIVIDFTHVIVNDFEQDGFDKAVSELVSIIATLE